MALSVPQMRSIAAANLSRAVPPVEPGVTGKEKMWQQNRQFGEAGAMVPYPGLQRPEGSRTHARPIPSGNQPRFKAQPIPNARGPLAPKGTPGGLRRPGEQVA
jgi:hypothetical protein